MEMQEVKRATVGKYPECFPPNIEDLIVKDGASENEFDYYRITKTGLINRDAFLSTMEENLRKDINSHIRDIYDSEAAQIDIGDYSTSGYEKEKDAKRILKCIKKYNEGPKLIVGKTIASCGLSMRTKESKTRKKRKDSHIDWWIYADSHPEKFFEEI